MLWILPKPILGTGYQLEEPLRFWGVLQFCLAPAVLYPKDSVVRVAIHLHVPPFLLDKGQGMNDGQEFSYVVGAMHRTVVEQSLLITQVDPLVFHRAWVTATASIHRNSVEIYYSL